NNSTWSNINGATAQTYTPGNLVASVYYRVITTSNGVSVTSNVSTITVYPQLLTSVSPVSKAINHNTSPGQLTGTATGGNSVYTYQWQSSSDNSTWSNIGGATSQNFTPGNLLSTTYYRLLATSNGLTVNSNTATITVYPQLTAGTVSPGSAVINYNTSPGALTCSAATGGSGTYAYQWQSSPDNSTWSNIAAATALSYTPGSLIANTWYRVVITSNGASVNSNIVPVSVYPELVADSIYPFVQDINAGDVLDSLRATPVTGGSGTYSYQWQSSEDNSTWNNIPGANGLRYLPGSIIGTRYYRLTCVDNGATVYSNTATVNVYVPLVVGSISPSGTSINYNTAPGELVATAASGGNGSYEYQWESATDATTWKPVAGATALHYTPDTLTVNTRFRLAVTSNRQTLYTNSVSVNVYPQLLTGRISPAMIVTNYSNIPPVFTATDPGGGDGTYSYQWQTSLDSTGNWSDIAGATALSYNPPDTTTGITYYRLAVTSHDVTAYTSVGILKRPLTGGIIKASAPIVPIGTSVDLQNIADATGNLCGGLQYTWQISEDAFTWSPLSGTIVPVLIPVFVRRLTICDNNIGYSNTIGIKPYDPNATPQPNDDSSPAAGTAPVTTMPDDNAVQDPENLNYIKAREFLKSDITDLPAADVEQDAFHVRQVTQYYDGIGRSMQTVAMRATPQGHDFVSTNFYDDFGRETQRFLPYAGTETDGKFKTNTSTAQPGFYDDLFNQQEGYYYSNITYEPSPLNRVVKTTAPGKSWTGKSVGIQQLDRTNDAYDNVPIWNIDAASTALPQVNGIYNLGTLAVNETIDENSNKVIEYKDLGGKVILKKVQLNPAGAPGYDDWLSTFYVYDELDNLRFVIPPKAVAAIKNDWTLTQAITDELCFWYQYDERKRMIVKHVPGTSAPTEMVYDVRDRLVFTRDGNLAGKGQWMATFYDNLNRPLMTALYNTNATREDLQTAMNTVTSGTLAVSSGPNTITVTNPLPGLVAANLDPQTYTFYDSYNFTGVQGVETGDLGKPQADNDQLGDIYPETVAVSNMTNGLVTGTKTRVLGTNQWLTSSTYYDDKGRAVQMISDNINGGKDIATSLYDFSGKLLSTNVNHTNPNSTAIPATNILTMSVYDHGGRLKTLNKVLNNDDKKTIADNTYDELGQLQTKGLGTNGVSSYLETLNYSYNIRGWLKGINADYVQPGGTGNWFGQELSYDYGFGTSQRNGNIAGIKWKSRGDGVARSYGFTYDNVNRLTGADFNQQNAGSTAWTKDKVNFTVENLTYDANGNILSMKQWGQKLSTPAVIDDMVYHYQADNNNSNKLQFVYDNANDENSTLGDFKEPAANNLSNKNNGQTDYDYQYDANGNLTLDNNKHIEGITYNYLNLPENITITGKGNIQYVYDAAGNKLRKVVTDNTTSTPKSTTTDYMGRLVYENNVLQFIGHEEGRIRAIMKTGQPVSYVYDYFIKDHLGNVRTVLTEETNQNTYAATMETEQSEAENALFSNIDNTRSAKPSGYPDDPTTDPNNYVSKLNAVNGQKIGPSLVLRVMAGDKIQIGAKAFYKSTGASTSSSPASDMVTAILNAFSGIPPLGDGSHVGVGTGSPIATNLNGTEYQYLKEKDPGQNLEDKPKSYLNFVLFDDQFNLVEENSGVKQVQGAPDELQTLATGQMEIKRTGFMYIYTSNESGEDVFFDNIVVQHTTGPLAEETHYYPFGLTMAGISSNALKGTNYPGNRFQFNGKELQSKEFGDGSGLEWYDYGARMYDQQIGRWHVQDLISAKYPYATPYHYTFNNPIRYIDPHGLDTSLYKLNSGALLATKAGQNDKTPIYVVDETADNYNKDDPWATAKPLTYQIGTKAGGISGKSFRDNHPLRGKGTKAGAQVYKEDLMDMTDEFDALVMGAIPEFEALKGKRGGMYGAKGSAFQDMVTDDAKYDLKSIKTDDGTPSYAAIVIGEWSFLNGTLRRYDDYGNISYGIFGKAAGFSDKDLYKGSNLNQTFKNLFGGTSGNGDENRDVYMIQTGIYNAKYFLNK
ncbi:MAG TPA: DUF6443 domain-containing protein, partial [Chitinophagaceae bacterium]|nr:DUF6443 domain-containing protein [Chitinophagaceae bacterium]